MKEEAEGEEEEVEGPSSSSSSSNAACVSGCVRILPTASTAAYTTSRSPLCLCLVAPAPVSQYARREERSEILCA